MCPFYRSESRVHDLFLNRDISRGTAIGVRLSVKHCISSRNDFFEDTGIVMLSNGGERFIQARTITLNQSRNTHQGQIGGSDSPQWYRFRLQQRSSVALQLKGAKSIAELDLAVDRNGNGILSRNEVIARTSRSRSAPDKIALPDLNRGTYFVRVSPTVDSGGQSASTGSKQYQLVVSQSALRGAAHPSKPWSAMGNIADNSMSASSDLAWQNYRLPNNTLPIRKAAGGLLASLFRRRNNSNNNISSVRLSSRRWNADFLNRNSNNVSDYRSFNFANADASKALGLRGKRGNVVARLNIDYGDQSPANGIQADNFAMQAGIRVPLTAGKFYRLTSNSNDGTRFFFRDRSSGKTLVELDGDWRDRDTTSPAWTQTISVTQSGRYDFFVQYYERTGKSALDVKLERVDPIGRIANTSGLNLRETPSTQNNTPIAGLDPGTTFRILRQVRSNDPTYSDWFEVVTNDGKRGYIAAGRGMVDMSDGSGIVTLSKQGGSVISNPNQGGVINNPPNNPNNPNNGNNNGNNGGNNGGTGGYPYPYPGGGTGNSGSGGKYTFNTNIPRDSGAYKPHLQELMNPTYYNGSYKPIIEQVSSQYNWLQPSVVAAIGSRESAWGLLLSPKGPNGTGDQGHGRGLMQIDDRFHQQFIRSGKWSDPRENITYAINQVLAPNYNQLAQTTNLQGVELLRATLASYNAGLGNVTDAIKQGLDPDYYTTGRDYGRDVLNRAGWFQLNGWS